jgi:hypothetical protein
MANTLSCYNISSMCDCISSFCFTSPFFDYVAINYVLWMRSGQVDRASDCQCKHCISPVAKFIVPDWGYILSLTPALGCRTGLPAYAAWRAGTTTLCRSQLYLPRRDCEFVYWVQTSNTVECVGAANEAVFNKIL